MVQPVTCGESIGLRLCAKRHRKDQHALVTVFAGNDFGMLTN